MSAEPTVFDVRSHVHTLLRSGQFGQNRSLPTERELCEATGASRRLVRRALASLEAEGLIWRRQGKGTFAGQPVEPLGVLAAEVNKSSDPIEVMEARLCIEPELAALAAERAKMDEVDRMLALARHAYAPEDGEANELWDSALHRMIARSAQNRPLLTAFAMLDAIRATEDWQDLRGEARSESSLDQSRQEHLHILDAITDRDADAARAAMHQHLENRQDALIKALAARPASAHQKGSEG